MTPDTEATDADTPDTGPFTGGDARVTDSYEIRRFRAAEQGSPEYARGADWIRAMGFGFHDTRRNDEFVGKVMAMYRLDDRELTGVYQTGAVATHSLGPEIPVATFGTLRKDLNTGYGR